MRVFDGYEVIPCGSPPRVVALGSFDGVHRGHCTLLLRTVARAHESGHCPTAYTFDPHPAAVLAPQFAPKMISSIGRRLELIEAQGIEACVVEPFTRELAALGPKEFFANILVSALGAEHVIVGYDFTFGRDRAGTTEVLTALGRQHGVSVEVVSAVDVDGIVASSTKVRNFLGDGNLSGAALLLGRPYDVEGVVVRGEQRGRELGYPTANIAPDVEVIVPTGIYAAWVEVLSGPLEGTRSLAATSLGTNPTFGDASQRTLEPHLLDFSGDLYEQRLRVELIEYLRPEQRFASMEELVFAIDRDIEETRRILQPNSTRQGK